MKSVSVIGFGTKCPEKNLKLANRTGKAIAKESYKIICGGCEWTFNNAFIGAKDENGSTKAILQKGVEPSSPEVIDEIIYVPDQQQKHENISNESVGAIVIGGGKGSAILVDMFLKKDKKIYMINNTGGITEETNYNHVPHIEGYEIEHAIEKITEAN